MTFAAAGYKPSPWGEMYHSRNEDEVLGAGSAGPGKTEVLLHDALPQIHVEHERCLLHPSHEHYHPFGSSVGWALYLRRTTPRLEHAINRCHRIFPLVDPGVKWLASKNTFIFSSGFRYQFGHCSERDDWEQFMSFEFTWMGFDELVEFEKEQFDQIGGRVRTSDPILRKMKKIRAMSNPVMRLVGNENIVNSDPMWVRKYFVEPDPEGNVIIKKPLKDQRGNVIDYHTRLYLPAKLDDNPNKLFVEDYKRTLLGKPPHIQQALLYGNWWITVGSFFGDAWDSRIHVCKPFSIPKDWPRFRSMDWGYKVNGCVHWWAMDPDGNLYCERELTFIEKTDAEVAKEIREIEKRAGLWGDNGSRITGPADTQLWEQRGDSSKSKADTMAENGVIWVPANKKSRAHNAERLLKRLTDHGGNRTMPGIVFFANAKMAIQTIPGIQTDPKDPNCPADGGDDHWLDSVLYACAYASHGRTGVSVPWDDDDDLEEEAEGSYGRDGYGSAY